MDRASSRRALARTRLPRALGGDMTWEKYRSVTCLNICRLSAADLRAIEYLDVMLGYNLIELSLAELMDRLFPVGPVRDPRWWITAGADAMSTGGAGWHLIT